MTGCSATAATKVSLGADDGVTRDGVADEDAVTVGILRAAKAGLDGLVGVVLADVGFATITVASAAVAVAASAAAAATAVAAGAALSVAVGGVSGLSSPNPSRAAMRLPVATNTPVSELV